MNNDDNNSDELHALIAQANALTATVSRLNEDVGDQVVELAQVNKRNSFMIKLLVIVVVVQFILGGLVTAALFGVKSNSDNLVEVRTTDRREALCPLYGLFLASKNDRARDAYPRGPEAYDEAFVIIQHGYDALECKMFEGGSESGN